MRILDFLHHEISNTAANPVRLAGGDINEVYRFELDNQQFVLKLNEHHSLPDLFKHEAEGLELLAQTHSFRIPRVIQVGTFETKQYLILEYIEAGKSDQTTWRNFAENLAKLHQSFGGKYGLSESNYIGSIVQANHFNENWVDFLITQRFDPLLRKAFSNRRIGIDQVKHFETIYARLDSLLITEKPCLIHGDLWSGNVLIDSGHQVSLIDPAVYYGHREMDLAMMDLFGGFPAEILSHYNSVYALQPGLAERIAIYQLYPLLVHLNLFGNSYWPGIHSRINPFN